MYDTQSHILLHIHTKYENNGRTGIQKHPLINLHEYKMIKGQGHIGIIFTKDTSTRSNRQNMNNII